MNNELVAENVSELSGVFGRGDIVRADAYMTTSGGESGPFSASVVIENSPPQLLDLSIEPSAPSLADALSARYSITDYDNDPASLTQCVWQKWTSGWVDMTGGGDGEFGACANNPL